MIILPKYQRENFGRFLDSIAPQLRTFLIAALTEAFSFFVIVANTRAFTHGLYGWTFVTDALFITQQFFVAKWMIEAKDARGLVAYFGFLTGGTSGSLLAILVTKHLYGG